MNKHFSIAAITTSLVFVLLAKYGFENTVSESLVTKVVTTLNFAKPPEQTAPSFSPTPFYQIEQNATYLLVLASMLCVIFSVAIELRRCLKHGKNRFSAGILAVSVSIIYFNLNIISWNFKGL